MKKEPKKRRPVSLYYGNGYELHNLTKGEALKICADLLQEYLTLTIKINEPDKKP
jgi:NAD(P)H-flavin reductase